MDPRQPPSPTYFLDENAESRELARLLSDAGLNCVRLSDAGPDFFKGMADVDWIERVATRGWWGVTLDGRTLKNTVERAAILRSSAVHIYIKAQQLVSAATAEALITARRDYNLERRIRERGRPTIVRMRATGDFKFDDDRSPRPRSKR